MLSLLFKAITPETSLWEGHTALITGAAREGNPLSGRCSGTGYRGQYCRNVTIHPPDNAFPGSCTKTEQRKRGICMAAAPQSLDRNSGGALYARGKKSLSQFFLSSQRRNHPRQSCCSSVTTSDSGTLCPSLRVPHRAAPPAWEICHPKHDTTNTLSQLSGWSEGNYLVHSWPRSFPSPSSGRPWPETGWEYSVFHPCAHVLPLVMATDAATRTPEEPLATHSGSDLRAKPAQGLPLAAFPRKLIWSPEAKLASSHPAMNPD